MFEAIVPQENEVLCFGCIHRRPANSSNPNHIRCNAFAPEDFIRENYEYIFGVIGPLRYFNWDPAAGDPVYTCEKYQQENN